MGQTWIATGSEMPESRPLGEGGHEVEAHEEVTAFARCHGTEKSLFFDNEEI
jgi:hypothetical protein